MINSAAVFILITIAAVAGIVLATGNNRKVLVTLTGWGALSGLLAYYGFYWNTEVLPPRILTILLPIVAIGYYLYLVVPLSSLHLGWLIAIHLVRIPVELILYRLFTQGLIPELMTYQGWNFDIASGISAVVVLMLYLTDRLTSRVLLYWNMAALCLLVIIVVSAVLSAPTPLQQLAFEQPNRAVLYFPFTWLPALVVPIVFLSHFFIFRICRSSRVGCQQKTGIYRSLYPNEP
jgi:hypothetical protein